MPSLDFNCCCFCNQRMKNMTATCRFRNLRWIPSVWQCWPQKDWLTFWYSWCPNAQKHPCYRSVFKWSENPHPRVAKNDKPVKTFSHQSLIANARSSRFSAFSYLCRTKCFCIGQCSKHNATNQRRKPWCEKVFSFVWHWKISAQDILAVTNPAALKVLSATHRTLLSKNPQNTALSTQQISQTGNRLSIEKALKGPPFRFSFGYTVITCSSSTCPILGTIYRLGVTLQPP